MKWERARTSWKSQAQSRTLFTPLGLMMSWRSQDPSIKEPSKHSWPRSQRRWRRTGRRQGSFRPTWCLMPTPRGSWWTMMWLLLPSYLSNLSVAYPARDIGGWILGGIGQPTICKMSTASKKKTLRGSLKVRNVFSMGSSSSLSLATFQSGRGHRYLNESFPSSQMTKSSQNLRDILDWMFMSPRMNSLTHQWDGIWKWEEEEDLWEVIGSWEQSP